MWDVRLICDYLGVVLQVYHGFCYVKAYKLLLVLGQKTRLNNKKRIYVDVCRLQSKESWP